jgi:hypothetical protein
MSASFKPAVLLRWTLTFLVLLVPKIASADSIQTFRITQVFVDIQPEPEENGGAFFAFEFDGRGITIFGQGGMVCNWCFDDHAVPDGFPIVLGNISYHSLQMFIGGNTYDVNNSSLSLPLFLTTFADLKVPDGSGPAILNNGVIFGQAGSGDNPFQFRLIMPRGNLGLGFVPAEKPSYYLFFRGGFFASAVVPEPGTLGLMATGLAGIVGLLRRKRERS